MKADWASSRLFSRALSFTTRTTAAVARTQRLEITLSPLSRPVRRNLCVDVGAARIPYAACRAQPVAVVQTLLSAAANALCTNRAPSELMRGDAKARMGMLVLVLVLHASLAQAQDRAVPAAPIADEAPREPRLDWRATAKVYVYAREEANAKLHYLGTSGLADQSPSGGRYLPAGRYTLLSALSQDQLLSTGLTLDLQPGRIYEVAIEHVERTRLVRSLAALAAVGLATASAVIVHHAVTRGVTHDFDRRGPATALFFGGMGLAVAAMLTLQFSGWDQHARASVVRIGGMP